MFEEWLGDKDILKKVSCHYKTGESLPDDLIDTLIKIKNLSSGGFVQRQLFLSLFSLHCFKDGSEKDIDQIGFDLFKRTCVSSFCDNNYHFYARFGHLTGYSSKYYAYMWSKVFAIDLFADIKKEGLLDPKIGKRLTKEVLSKGGSKDPHELLKTFLGREPNQENFLKDLGLNS